MSATTVYSEVVEAEGHLIDSQILNVVFDTVVKHDASFDVLKFSIGKSNDEPSKIAMRISAASPQMLGEVLEELVALGCRLSDQQDAQMKAADQDGCVPDDFYSTTNHRTLVRLKKKWIEVERQRMDAVIVVEGARALCRKLRDVKVGDQVVCGVAGIRVIPEFQERDRHGFAFMTNEISSERRVEVGVARIAAMMQEVKAAGGKIAVVAGPVIVHTGGSIHFQESDSIRLRQRPARRQRARGSRCRAGAVRHVARRRSRYRQGDRGRPPPPHARDQHDLPCRG
jgi:lysine-ketoglutarate reductase/saccharopine dehydrogenase-like protein (TIGR00300 family)